jgi:hypothetical protein
MSNAAGAGTSPETWSEKAKVSICKENGYEVLFGSLTETIDIDLGDKDIEQIATTSGGRLVKYNPQDITTVTLEAYPLEAGTVAGADNAAGLGFFDLMNTADTSEPQQITVNHTRDRYRIAILWTNDISATTYAYSALSAATYKGLRFVGCGFFTSVKPAFTDGVLKFTVQMKIPAFKKDGSANLKIESGDGTATLTALGSFTDTQNWS